MKVLSVNLNVSDIGSIAALPGIFKVSEVGDRTLVEFRADKLSHIEMEVFANDLEEKTEMEGLFTEIFYMCYEEKIDAQLWFER